MAQAVSVAPLNIDLELSGVRPSLIVKGSANSSNISGVVSMLDRLTDEDHRCVSLDLGGVESMDTAAIESLVESANGLKGKRRRMHLNQASHAVQSLLDRLLLSELFCCERECICGCTPETCRIATKTWDIDVFTLQCSMDFCQEARARVKRVAEAVGFSKCKRDDILLAVGEAVANAIRHGKSADGEGNFTISCLATSERFSISISDSGSGFDPKELPTLEEALFLEHGRGVHCMNAVMDDVNFDFTGGTTVRMIKSGP